MSAMSDTPQPGAGDTTPVLVALARLEGKLDVVATQHGAQLTEHARRLDEQARRQDDADARLRAVESRPVVTPRAVWAGVGTISAVVLGAVGVVVNLVA